MSKTKSPFAFARCRAVFAVACGVLGGVAAERLFADTPAATPLARDAALTFRFAGAGAAGAVALDRITVRAVADPTTGPTGSFIVGRPLVDPATGGSVVVRPEAVREYFQLVLDLSPEDAAEKAERTLARVERTGDLRPLAAIDEALRSALGPAAGTRLDDPSVTAFYPASGSQEVPSTEYRKLIAGDDAQWRAYLTGGDIGAYFELQAEPAFERFRHTIDPDSGVPSADSALRLREHRRVLMRRAKNYVTFLPQIPMRADLADAAYAAGASYRASVGRSVRASVRSLVPAGGATMKFVRGLAVFDVAADTGDGGVFGGDTTSAAVGPADAPRVVNVTPPDGETFVDPSTDWEDPDNQFTVPIPQRRYFVIRLRFSKPLDPRTVDAAHFSLSRVVTIDMGDGPTPVSTPVPLGVFLAQRRMGEVLVEVTPFAPLDMAATHELRVLGTVKSLDGTPLGADFVTTFR